MRVVSWDWEFDGGVGPLAAHAEGFARRPLVDRSLGAVHTDVAICRLSPGGSIDAHVHSFERCAYVLGGTPILELEGRTYRFGFGDYVLFPVGVVHSWRNEGDDEARWVEVSSPLPSSDEAGGPDTFFLPPGPRSAWEAGAIDPSNPTSRWVGHYEGTTSQIEALAVDGPIRGRKPAGMDTALLAYSGITIKMLVDQGLGADLLTMFMVDYEPGGAAQVHDHPFEEAYLFLAGEIEGEVNGQSRIFRAGEILFCGVGEEHGFFNSSGGHVRWIETQAPQPPRHHSYRWPAYWKRLREQFERSMSSEPDGSGLPTGVTSH